MCVLVVMSLTSARRIPLPCRRNDNQRPHSLEEPQRLPPRCGFPQSSASPPPVHTPTDQPPKPRGPSVQPPPLHLTDPPRRALPHQA